MTISASELQQFLMLVDKGYGLNGLNTVPNAAYKPFFLRTARTALRGVTPDNHYQPMQNRLGSVVPMKNVGDMLSWNRAIDGIITDAWTLSDRYKESSEAGLEADDIVDPISDFVFQKRSSDHFLKNLGLIGGGDDDHGVGAKDHFYKYLFSMLKRPDALTGINGLLMERDLQIFAWFMRNHTEITPHLPAPQMPERKGVILDFIAASASLNKPAQPAPQTPATLISLEHVRRKRTANSPEA